MFRVIENIVEVLYIVQNPVGFGNGSMGPIFTTISRLPSEFRVASDLKSSTVG